MYKWLRYSGATITVIVNPLHWVWTPIYGRTPFDEWVGPKERSYLLRWLFLTVRVWLDDGSW